MDFSQIQIETDRLVLRPYKKDDFQRWFTQFANRLQSQYKYDDGLPRDMSTFTEEWFTNWVHTFDEKAKKDEMYNLGIFRKEDGANVGKVELITILRMDYQWAMMGYSIHNQFWKKGYGTESVLAATEFFFQDLHFHRIELHINPDNHPSIRLAERTGFKFECERKEFSFENDKWADFLIYYKNNQTP